MKGDGYFTTEELQDLINMIREEYLRSSGSARPCSMSSDFDTSRPAHEAYRTDFELFREIFEILSPWGRGKKGHRIARRLFKVCKGRDTGGRKYNLVILCLKSF